MAVLMLDAGYLMVDTVCWMVDAGFKFENASADRMNSGWNYG
jgi:hypothetical protein